MSSNNYIKQMANNRFLRRLHHRTYFQWISRVVINRLTTSGHLPGEGIFPDDFRSLTWRMNISWWLQTTYLAKEYFLTTAGHLPGEGISPDGCTPLTCEGISPEGCTPLTWRRNISWRRTPALGSTQPIATEVQPHSEESKVFY